MFPERTSVLWTTVESGARRLRLRIWERGAGETLGCGTGACAAAVAAITEGRIAAAVDTESVEVTSRGGTLRVAWAGGASPIYLAGPARVVYTGAWRLA
jgi:diaminopimelate epimerase